MSADVIIVNGLSFGDRTQGFSHLDLPCGYTPQLGPHKNAIHKEIAKFFGKSNVSYPDFSAKKAG